MASSKMVIYGRDGRLKERQKRPTGDQRLGTYRNIPFPVGMV